MSEHRDEYVDLCAGYALGSLSEADRNALERHLEEGCETCDRALAAFGEGSQLLAASLPPSYPSPAFRERVLRVIRSEAGARARGTPAAVPQDARHAPGEATHPGEAAHPGEGRGASGESMPGAIVIPIKPRPRWTWLGVIGWASAAVLAVTAGTFWETILRLRAEIRTREGRVVEVSRALELERGWATVLSAPGARVAEMKMTPTGETTLQGRAIYDPASRRAVVVFRSAFAPTDRDYQLWAIRGGVTVSVGVIQPDGRGVAVFRLENLGDPATTQAFAVSLEPKGGSPNTAAPTGPVILTAPLEA